MHFKFLFIYKFQKLVTISQNYVYQLLIQMTALVLKYIKLLYSCYIWEKAASQNVPYRSYSYDRKDVSMTVI